MPSLVAGKVCMTQEQKRIKIAEACGYRTSYRDPEAWHPLPDYFSDLNAMHEAEKVLYRGIEHHRYWQAGYGRFKTILGEICDDPYSATAAQRAEAFGRTLGIWA